MDRQWERDMQEWGVTAWSFCGENDGRHLVRATGRTITMCILSAK